MRRNYYLLFGFLAFFAFTSTYAQIDVFVSSQGELFISKDSYVYIDNSGVIDVDTGGECVIDSDSDEFGQLYVDGVMSSISSGGVVEYRRHAPVFSTNRDLIAPPVAGSQTFESFRLLNANLPAGTLGGDNLFGPFDNNTSYVEYNDGDTSIINLGTGYRTATTDGGTLAFQGDVLSDTKTINVSVGTATQFSRGNLIGNPYTTYIKAEDVVSVLSSSSGINSSYVAIYGWNGSGTNDGSTWTVINNLNSSGVEMAPGQAFFVIASDMGGSLDFAPSMRVVSSGDDFMAGEANNAQAMSNFKIRIEKNSDANQFYSSDIYFLDNNGTRGLDPGWDAGAITLPGLSVASLLADGSSAVPFQIQCLSNAELISSDNDLIVPLHVNASQGESYILKMENSTLPSGAEIYLHDTELNTVVLLDETNPYTFNLDSSSLSGAGRFYLRTTNETLSLPTVGVDDFEILSLANSKQLLVKGEFYDDAELYLYDITGREVTNFNVSSGKNAHYFDVSNLNSGVYVVKLLSNGRDTSKKVVIY